MEKISKVIERIARTSEEAARLSLSCPLFDKVEWCEKFIPTYWFKDASRLVIDSIALDKFTGFDN